MMRDILISEFKKQFPKSNFKEGTSPDEIAIFPAMHPDVGDVVIIDEQSEITVLVGNISHGHFSCYDSELTVSKREDLIIKDVIKFLEDLFSDKVLLWASESGAGGWIIMKNPKEIKQISEWKGFKDLVDSGLEILKEDGRYFLWSGPVEKAG